jgi:DNA replication protein DnaC
MIKRIEENCKKLKLGRTLADNIKKIELTDKYEFILKLFEMEVEHRDIQRRTRNISSAGFYAMKTLSDYSFTDITLPDKINIVDLKSAEFIKNKENLIMYGNPGTGKTHLATALGIEACRMDFKTGFFRTASLVNKLTEAKKANELGRLYNKLSKLNLLILDEWGYVPLDKEGSQLLFQIISDCYETRSVIITTNLEFSKWINIFYDKEMTAAMIDRLIHHSHLLLFEGESYRVKNSLIRKAS